MFIMKKDLFLAALATIVLTACSGDLADTPPVVVPTPENLETPIVFSSASNGLTRTEYVGAVAADMLGKKFVVTGYKGSSTATTSPDIVYDNFLVEWRENTANTTESNTADWEYVGVRPIAHATANGVTQQAIKYWDYTQSQYDFIAWSSGKKTAIYSGTPADGEVLVSAITPASATGASGAAYTFTGKAKDLVDCYVADLVTVKKDGTGKGAYGQPVKLTFRSLGSKVRIGIYETIPGYSVKEVEFYSAAATDDAAPTPRVFTTSDNQVYLEGIYTVFYPTVDTPDNKDNNQAHIRFTGTGDKSPIVDFGSLAYTSKEDAEKTMGNVFLGRTSNTASMAGEAEGNYYTQYLPNEIGTNLNLRVNYTLESIDGTGEIIHVKGATAQVPSIYTQWKAGYAYTYLFKISDKTNGHTGVYDPLHPDDLTVNSDPAGLYPITFDAVVINDEEDATQETITLVSTPSITTYQKGSKVVDNDEYLAATGDIFVTVNDGTTASTPDLANGGLQTLTGKAALYTIPAGKTEAEVIDAFLIPDDNAATGTAKGRNGLVLTEAPFTLVNSIEYGVDGNAISVGTEQALRFTPAAGTYAFVYTKTAPTTQTETYSYVTKAAGDDVAGLYRNFSLTEVTGDAQSGVVYMSKSAEGVLTRETVFVGQGVGNLYTRTGSGSDADPYVYTAATGYAATGTAYYYTLDGGTTYQLAHNVAYADFATATLYTDATAATPKTNTTPVAGSAYYTADGTYCVILPQQVAGWYRYVYSPSEKYACMSGEKAISGAAYFDKYFQNNGVYYTKVIKVQ